MRATSSKQMRAKLLILFFGLPLLFACLSGCGGPPSAQGEGGQSPSAPGPGGVPELTDEMIRERINFAFIRKIPEENGDGEPMSWTFMPDEPKDISIVEKKIEGNHATVVLDVKTGSGPRANGPRSLAGQIRTEWELRTGWVLRQWDIVDTENISMKYKKLPKLPLPDNSNTGQHGDDSDLPKPPAQNSNH